MRPRGDGPTLRPVRGARALSRRLSDEVVCQLVKRYGAAAGLEPAKLGAHSLRVGYATQGFANGAFPVKVKEQLRHRGSTPPSANIGLGPSGAARRLPLFFGVRTVGVPSQRDRSQ